MQEQLSTILIEEMYSISAAGWPAFKVSGRTPNNSTNDAPAGLNVSGPDPFVLLLGGHIRPDLLLGNPHWTRSVIGQATLGPICKCRYQRAEPICLCCYWVATSDPISYW